LAIGIFLGSAVGEPTIVDNLNRTIRNVSGQIKARNAENAQLRRENDRLKSFEDATSGFTVQNRLESLDVALIAERGVDRRSVEGTRDLLRAADANAPVIVWLEPRWSLTNPDDVDRMAALLQSASRNPSVLRRDAFNLLARRIASNPQTTVPAATGKTTPDFLQQLVDAKFVSVDGLNKDQYSTFPVGVGRASAVVVDGDEGDIQDPTVFSAVVSALSARGITTVAAEVGSDSNGAGDTTNRGDVISVIRSDSNLDGKVSTVDDLDLLEGRIATVLALQETNDSPNGTVGDYGYGPGQHVKPVPELQSR
jgi:hypothetical protein